MRRIGELALGLVAVASVVLLAQATAWAAPPAASAVSDYEISLKELRQVKKATPPKKKEGEVRKRKKSSARAQKPAADELSPKEGPSPEKKGDAAPQSSQDVIISHEPYSYLVAGKRTVIRAVISSAEDVKSVSCRFRAVEGGAGAVVGMAKESGAQFTYAATLPALTAESRFLRYNIVVVDANGRETRSREFVINVKPSQVVPGWQFEASDDKLRIELENNEKPLQGFSDQGLSK